jgi:eukaryotic-like serine/threonine-protein kinase
LALRSGQRELGDSDSGACLSDDVLFAFATGSIDELARTRAEAHVADCADCRTVLAQAARALGECNSEVSESADASRSIGRYRLSALLGAGAAGVVYRAFDPELERVVALKILVSTAEDSARGPREQILREARAMAQLSHPNVVTVFDVGLAEDSVFIVMEYAPGTTLEHWLRAAARSQDEIVRAFVAAGRGLAAAHAKRLVHRDFKPENVLVSSDGQVKVTDFGLARSLGSAEPGVLSGLKGSDVTTRTRGVFGTPAYMAPELFSGAPADAASDQFSFCVALLAALLGRHPFGADEGVRVSELILRMQGARIDFSGSRLGPGLKAALLRGVRAEPGARFPDMPALLAALEREVGRARRPRRDVLFSTAVTALALVVVAVVFRLAESTPNLISSGRSNRVLSSKASLVVSAVSSADATPAPAPRPSVPEVSAPPSARSSTAAVRKPEPRKPSKPPEAVRYNDALREPF